MSNSNNNRRLGIDVNETSDLTKTPLECALDNDCASVIEALLDNGAKPYGRGELEIPILYLAAFGDCLQSVRALVLRDNIMIEDGQLSEFTALHVAVKGDNPHIVRALLDAGADTKRRGPDGLTPLQLARKLSLPDVIREFRAELTESGRSDSASDVSDTSQTSAEEVD